MRSKKGFADTLMIAWVLLLFTVILEVGSLATAGKPPADFTANQLVASVEQTLPLIRLAQFTNPPAGTMLGGAGIFAPPGILLAPGGSGGIYFVPDRESGVPIAPSPARSPYRRCPYGGFDCDL